MTMDEFEQLKRSMRVERQTERSATLEMVGLALVVGILLFVAWLLMEDVINFNWFI